MVTYSAAPLESASVALIEPFAFKSLSTADGVYLHRFFSALGFGRVLDARLASLGSVDENINAFFRSVIAEAQSFKENAGLYITDDIIKTIEGNSIIVKISVTCEDITEDTNGSGGVVTFVIPTSDTHNAMLVSSGGIAKPAFLNGVGVSVLPVDFAFQNIGETLYTISQLVLGTEEESAATNWSTGANISVTLYRSNGEAVNKLYQLIIRKDGDTIICKEADANSDGYIPITEWKDVEPGQHVISSFVFRAHEKVAEALNSTEGKQVSLAIVGSDEEAAPAESKNERFRPVFLGEHEPLAREDAFGIDAHPVHAEDLLPVTESITLAPVHEAPLSNETYEVPTEDAITSPEEINTVDDLVNFAEYEVTHSEEPAVSGEVNDATAETADPFELGAEYLIHEGLGEDIAADVLEVPTEAEVASEEDVIPLTEIADPEQPATDYNDLQWSEVVTGSVETQQEGVAEPDAEDQFGDLSWDEVALTIADADSNSDGGAAPIKGFLDRK